MNKRWIKFELADKATHPKDCSDVFILNHYGIVQTALFNSEQFCCGDEKLEVQPEYWQDIEYPIFPSGWVTFEATDKATHPEHYRTCQLVSDSIKWEDEAFYCFDGELWWVAGHIRYILDDNYLQGLKWHYLNLPSKP